LVHAVADFGGPILDAHNLDADDLDHRQAEIKAEVESGPPATLPVGTKEQPETEQPGSKPLPTEAAKTEPPVSELPRRRSTVREPVRLLDNPALVTPAATAVPPEPVTSTGAAVSPAELPAVPAGKSTEADTAASAPRRAGWWAKRLFGENK
jgi:hypothetical protein